MKIHLTPHPAPGTEVQVPMFTVTPKAAARVKALLEKKGLAEGYLRVTVVSGGCSGLEFKLDLDDKLEPGEQSFESNGVKVAADFKVQLYMGGSEIDYKETLMKSGFEVRNPQAVSTCACGTSFST